MNIATILNVHGDTPTVLDTIDAVKTYVGQDVLVVADGATWESWGKDVKLPVHKIQGFVHGYPKAPYRNLTLGLKAAVETFPEADWYCYSEFDVLFTSDKFKQDLYHAAQNNVWCIGNDLRHYSMDLPYLDRIVGEKVINYRYLLGCCVFHQGTFLRKLNNIGFFDKFLMMTNEFIEGHFPNFKEYDFGEHLYPTLAAHFGGQVAQFAVWNQCLEQWNGFFKKYPMRWQPEIGWDDNFDGASILHPVKANNDLRWFHSMKRKRQRQHV